MNYRYLEAKMYHADNAILNFAINVQMYAMLNNNWALCKMLCNKFSGDSHWNKWIT